MNNRFDMDACLRERKEGTNRTPARKDFRLRTELRVAGVSDSLSAFGTRVVINEVLQGKSMNVAIEKALTLRGSAKKGD